MIPGWLHWLPLWLGSAIFVVTLAAALYAAGHALLFKREPRAALGWVAVSLFFPVFGALAYYLFGINRIRTRARRMRSADSKRIRHRPGVAAPAGLHTPGGLLETGADPEGPDTELDALVRLSTLVTQREPVAGNRLEPLFDGEETYPAMIGAIDSARRSVYLMTYIFESNATGRGFVDALDRARRRGVAVRVLVDGVGELYGFPPIRRLLRRRGIPVARFLPPRLIPPQVNINLRNHRKVLVVDSSVGFTGGINIGDRHVIGDGADPDRVRDVHFRVSGPIVSQLEAIFLDDWEFVTGESLEVGPAPEPTGDSWVRSVPDGPADEVDQLLTVLIGAVSVARRRVWIMTPYFTPPRELIEALKSAALRGVDVRIVLPAHNNLPFVHWASRNFAHELLEWGVRIYYQGPLMVHSKLLLIDDDYVQAGSANLDTRSLRLNFELTLEVYDRELADQIADHVGAALRDGREVGLAELRARPLWVRLRDAAAWLITPYL